jgi:hypothetical protein
MRDWLLALGILVIWLALQFIVVPRFGIRT